METEVSDLEDLFENADFALHIVASDGTILRANPSELDLLGCSAEDYVGRNIADFHADRATIEDILARLSRGEKVKRYPARLRAKDGSIRHVEITSSGRFRDGQFSSTRCLTIDVTQAKLAEKEREELECHWRRAEVEAARLGAIVVSSNDAIVSKTLDGVVTSWNAAAERMFGYRAEEIIGQPILRIIPPERHDEEREILAKLRRGERVEHFETVRVTKDERRIFVSLSVSPVADRSGRLIGAAKVARDITERKQAEETQRLLLSELNHRVKNTLATVQAIATQTLRWSTNPAEFVPSFLGRLQALAGAHTLLTETNWQGAELGALIRSQVIPDGTTDERIICSGPEVLLPSALALPLAMIAHELATNARKHGALSAIRGGVSVKWSLQSTPMWVLQLTWVESGGPPWNSALRRGFGTTLIDRSIQAIEGAQANMEVEADGIRWSFIVPLSSSSHAQRMKPPSPPQVAAVTQGKISEPQIKSVLLVEDEPLIALDIGGILSDAGFRVLGPASTLDEAVRLSATALIDAALLDANLGGKPVDEVASVLTRRGIPFIFVTGYGREALPESFASAPTLTKPFTPAALLREIRSMFSRGAIELRRD